MLIFAKFTMRDSGLPIHINTPHVTQVRLTIDGEPAIYLVGKETPIVVEGTLDAALKKLEAAGAGFRLVEPELPAPVAAPAPAAVTFLSVAAPPPSPPPAPSPAPSPAPVAVAKPAPKPKPQAAAKARPVPKKPAPKPEVVAVLPPLPPPPPVEAKKPVKAAPTAPPEQHSGAMSWFKGLR